MITDEEIFEEALTLQPTDRAALLERRCTANAAQRARLERLLEAHGHAAEFLAAPAVDRRLSPADEKPGDVIDRYKLVERIGEGGWGVVWLAQQDQPLRRQLALKIVKLGMDTKAVVARFAAERQAVAMMDHPNIARLYDAGVTATGRPYFVMELVRGVAITRYCDTHHLTTAQRLELFIAVCDAVQHAHQKGLIHRDLKPSNILVTSDGGSATPKVIDFGIAKAIQGPLTDETVFTAVEQFVGTPVYMSPEQADLRSADVDTRSDIYSLGVLLFELLTGGPPFDAKTLLEGGVSAMRQRLQEAEPDRPSTRVGTLVAEDRAEVAQRRGTTSPQLAPQLRGDLDWIVMRCLEKDRTRRYESASALGQDLRRHLRNEPVLARPPGRLYVAGKLIRRHRVAVAGIAATLAMLMIGGGMSAWQAVRATRAEREQSRLRSVAEAQEQVARRRAYAADMNLAQQAHASDNLGLARRLLNRHRPEAGELDLRGWEWRYLWQLTRSEAEKMVAKKNHPVSSISRSPDGEWLALGQADGGELSLHHLRTGKDVRLPLGTGAVRAQFSPVEPLLVIAFATSREQNHVRLWNVVTQETVAEWTSPVPPGPMFFSSDGRTLAMVGAGRGFEEQIVQWRIPTGEPLETAATIGGGGALMRLAVDPDAQLVAREINRGTRGVIQVLDLATGAERWSAVASEENISAFAFSADGRLLATAAGNTESSIRIWDVATGKPLGRLEGHRTYVAALLFWPDGRTLASAGTDQTVRLWDLNTWEVRRVLRGHELEVHSLALLPDQNTLVSGAKDGTVLLWNTAKPPPHHQSRVESVVSWRFHAGGQALVTLNNSGNVVRHAGRHFGDATPAMEIGRQPPGPGRTVFSADRPWLAVNNGGAVQIINWRENRIAHHISVGAPAVTLVGFTDGGNRLLLAHDGPPAGRHALHEWSVADGRILRSWPQPASPSPQYILSPGGTRCTVRHPDGTLTLIDLQSGTERRLAITAPPPPAPALSADGRLVATASTVGWVKIWPLDAAEPVAELSGFILGVHSVLFSSDGKRLVTGSGGSEAVRVWDAVSFEPLLTLAAQGTRFASIAFSSDGNTIGARNALEQLYLWRAPSWAEIESAEQGAVAK